METLDINSEKVVVKLFDISKVDDIECRFNSIIEETNIDIFVNNAGINQGNNFPDTKEADFDRVVNVNLKGMYFASQLFAKYMVKENIHGNILNVTSSSALRPAISPYIITKWGERGLTLGMAKKYLPYGIIVNGIAPGSTLTPMLKRDESDNLSLEYSPAKRYVSPEEVGNIATILVSSIGRMIIGDTIYITGGAGIITYDDMTY